MESTEDEGSDGIDDLINEAAGDAGLYSAETPEEDLENPDGDEGQIKKRLWEKRWLLSGGAIVFILPALMFFLPSADNRGTLPVPPVKPDKPVLIKLPDVDNRAGKRIDYELEPFFIPIEEGNFFLRLTILLTGLAEGLDKKIKMNPHKYRGAVINVFDGKKASDIEGKRGREKIKDEIESRFKDIGGGEMLEEVVFTSYILNK